MNYVFVIIGVGGTGSLVARDIPKLLINTRNKMVVIDGDMVEEKNMVRQAYQKHDIHENKAIALSAKINSFHWHLCEAFNKYITKDEIQSLLQKYAGYTPVLIGCVDNNSTRRILEKTFNALQEVVYIDSANSENDGDVYVAVKSKRKTIGALRGKSYKLKNEGHPTEKSCQELAKDNVQYMITNLKMATVVLEHVNSILIGKIKEGVTRVCRFETIHFK